MKEKRNQQLQSTPSPALRRTFAKWQLGSDSFVCKLVVRLDA